MEELQSLLKYLKGKGLSDTAIPLDVWCAMIDYYNDKDEDTSVESSGSETNMVDNLDYDTVTVSDYFSERDFFYLPNKKVIIKLKRGKKVIHTIRL